ncbi:MAG: prolipoprotein diacylglyceryl transferase [Patescibacteria group bacterium]
MWWQNYWPQANIFTVGPIAVHWYGLILAFGLLAAGFYSYYQLRKKQILIASQFEDLIFYLVIFSLLGARIGHVFFTWYYYQDHLADILKVWQGGLSWWGGFLAGVCVLIWWAKKHQMNFFAIADIVAPAAALGQAIGRWGNYFNQELYGRPTNGWWGIAIAPQHRLSGYERYDYFQPTFFYEFILNLLLFFALNKFLQFAKIKTGLVTWLYLAGYALIRFSLEFIRIDDTPTWWFLRAPQVISLLVFILAIFSIIGLRHKPLSKS